MSGEQLGNLHDVILQIVRDFDAFCEEHDITYYLMGGSALGAMRHQGFIPWDDDFDVFMDSSNYYRFLKIAGSALDTSKYHLQEEDSREWELFFSKIRMNGTTFIEEDIAHLHMHHGIYIDIMCLNNAFESKPLRLLQYFSARLLSASVLGRRSYSTTSVLKKIGSKFASLVVRGFVKSALLWFVRSRNAAPSKSVGHFFGRAPFNRTTFPASFLSIPRYVAFEGLLLPVPKHVESYLDVRYGRHWMDWPSQEVIESYPSHGFIVDTKKDYSLYIKELRLK